MNMESLSAGLSGMYDKGYSRGVADERARHALREWDSVPNASDWYWFDGETMGEWPGEWDKRQTIVYVYASSPGGYERVEIDGKEYEVREFRGTFRGPIPNPFEQEAE